MKSTTLRMIGLVTAFVLLPVCVGPAQANDLRIDNVRFINRPGATGELRVVFDLTWHNAWHHARSHDAAWVFLKLVYGGQGVRGDMQTVCNTGGGPGWVAATGAGFRMIADLGDDKQGLWTIDAQSQSGQPGSPHYRDQLEDWLAPA